MGTKHMDGKPSPRVLQLTLHLVSNEYLDEVVGGVNGLEQERAIRVDEIYTPESGITVELTLGLFSKCTDYGATLIINHWVEEYAEAIDDFELSGLVVGNIITVNVGSSGPATNVQQLFALQGGPNVTGKPRYHPGELQRNQALINRDGNRCTGCGSQLYPESTRNVTVVKPIKNIQRDHDLNTIHNQAKKAVGISVSVGVCYWCERAGVIDLPTLYRRSQSIGYKAPYAAIAQRMIEVAQCHSVYTDIAVTTAQLAAAMADGDDTRVQALNEYIAWNERDYKRQLQQQSRERMFENVFQRDQSRSCCWCNTSFTKDLIPTIEHLIPKTHGGRNHVDNYMAACAPCNHARSSYTATRWLVECHSRGWNPNVQAIALRLSSLAGSPSMDESREACYELEKMIEHRMMNQLAV